jgi:ABC-type multidrug transport system fused ATPase/permease subunit
VGGLRFFFSSTLVQVLTSILRLIGGIVLLIYLKWQLALLVLIALPVMLLLVRFFAKKMRILSHHSMEQHAQVSQAMQESLSSTDLIKSFSTEKRTVGQVVSNLKKAMHLSLEQTTMSSAAGISIGLVPEIARVIVLLAGAYWVIMGDWTLGSLLAFRTYVGFVYGPAQFLSSVNINLQNALAALERVSALFDIVPEENLEKGKKVKKLKGEIQFENVSFGYSQEDTVLDDVSFKVPAGGQVAIVGPSGVGKTTILSLILCFYKPSQGKILFDGLPVSNYNLTDLRLRIGYVSQKPLLLSGTILDNLRYGNPRAAESQVIQMAKAANIHDFITGLPDGYLSKVGERGVNLSEGQIQRIALGRALLKEPDILILDEPASALDALTEDSIFKALPALVKNKTLFIVAHRKSTIHKAKQILLLNEKQLVGMGTHQELQKSSAYYRSLLSSQEISE